MRALVRIHEPSLEIEIEGTDIRVIREELRKFRAFVGWLNRAPRIEYQTVPRWKQDRENYLRGYNSGYRAGRRFTEPALLAAREPGAHG